MNLKNIAVSLLLLAASVGVYAQAELPEALPPIETQGAVKFVCGGVGEDEADAMRAVRKQFNLQLRFTAGKDGRYLADVGVVVKDGKGKVLVQTKAGGPLCLLKLPNGDYGIDASVGSQVRKQTAKVSAGVTEIDFRWAEEAAPATPAAKP